MTDTIRIMPDEDGFHWRGVRPEDEGLVTEIMLDGVPGSPRGYDDRPLDSTLGGFCREAMRQGHRVITTEG